MGLQLRLSLLRGVEPADVWGALRTFYRARGAALVEEPLRHKRFDLYARDGDWTALDWDAGWEWQLRRKALRFVSRRLHCVSLLVFVFDGDYWGYELVRDGEPLDRFVQSADDAKTWFPGEPSEGDAPTLAAEIGRGADEVSAYLVRKPVAEDEAAAAARRRLDVPARPGDEHTRFHECAALDFLRLCGVRVAMTDGYVQLAAPLWRSFGVRFADG